MPTPIVSFDGPELAFAFHPGCGGVWEFFRAADADGQTPLPLAGWGATLVAQYDDGTPVYPTLSTAGITPAIVIDPATDVGTVTFPAVAPPVADPKTGARRPARFTFTLYPPAGSGVRYCGAKGRMTWGLGPASPEAP